MKRRSSEVSLCHKVHQFLKACKFQLSLLEHAHLPVCFCSDINTFQTFLGHHVSRTGIILQVCNWVFQQMMCGNILFALGCISGLSPATVSPSDEITTWKQEGGPVLLHIISLYFCVYGDILTNILLLTFFLKHPVYLTTWKQEGGPIFLQTGSPYFYIQSPPLSLLHPVITLRWSQSLT